VKQQYKKYRMMGTKHTHGADYKMFQMSFFIEYPLAVITPHHHQQAFPSKGSRAGARLCGLGETTIEGMPADGFTEREAKVVTFKEAKKASGGVYFSWSEIEQLKVSGEN
jgi:hypothetical protein